MKNSAKLTVFLAAVVLLAIVVQPVLAAVGLPGGIPAWLPGEPQSNGGSASVSQYFEATGLALDQPDPAAGMLAPSGLPAYLPGLAPAAPPLAKVAVFDDPAYVDTAKNTNEQESDNIQASLKMLGHTVITFTGISDADFSAALAGQDILLIPELENGDLGAALSITATGVISNFVASGGGLIIHGAHSITDAAAHAPSFLNQVFGIVVASAGVVTETGTVDLNQAAAAGTAFAVGPSRISNVDATQYLLSGSWPANWKRIYASTNFLTTSVALFPFGTGQIVFMGWDWFAPPIGKKGQDWHVVLDNAVHQLLPPDLRIAKTVSSGTVGAGQPLAYTLTFSNAGGKANGLVPTNVIITDVVPISLTNVSFTSSGATVTPVGGVKYVWQVADLLPAAGGVITITGTVNPDLTAGVTFTNTAAIATTTSEVDTGNNTAQAGVVVTEVTFVYLPLVVR